MSKLEEFLQGWLSKGIPLAVGSAQRYGEQRMEREKEERTMRGTLEKELMRKQEKQESRDISEKHHRERLEMQKESAFISGGYREEAQKMAKEKHLFQKEKVKREEEKSLISKHHTPENQKTLNVYRKGLGGITVDNIQALPEQERTVVLDAIKTSTLNRVSPKGIKAFLMKGGATGVEGASNDEIYEAYIDSLRGVSLGDEEKLEEVKQDLVEMVQEGTLKVDEASSIYSALSLEEFTEGEKSQLEEFAGKALKKIGKFFK